MALIFQRIENGSFVYLDQDTGEEISSNSVNENALNNPIGSIDTKLQGETTFENGGLLGGDTTAYPYEKVVQSRQYDPNGDGTLVSAGPAVRSYFNNWSLFKWKSFANGSGMSDSSFDPTAYQRADVNETTINPTANNIVKWSQDLGSFGYSYKFSDFIQCQHYGKISNNYMLTLRRFPMPVEDDIITPKKLGANGEPQPAQQPDMARAISWMSPALGNDIKEILNFSVGFPYKEEVAAIQSVTPRTGRGKLGEMVAGSPTLSTLEGSARGYNYAQIAEIRRRGAGWDPISETYPNAIFGPLNVIKSMQVRDQGLNFDQSFDLSFYFDIRGYGKTSPKAAFIDTMANLLVLTYNNAPFWGGDVRNLSNGQIGPPFGDYSKLAAGDYKGFSKSLIDQLSNAVSGISTDSFGSFVDSVASKFGDSKLLDNIIGGGLMELLDGPQGATIINAFITGEPTGQWHLTVGNPLNPIMCIGNLIMSDAKFELDGPLGFEDFPSKLKVTISLKPGRPRDKSGIESMFNAGRGRIYLQPDGERGVEFTDVNAYGKPSSFFEGSAGLFEATSNLTLG